MTGWAEPVAAAASKGGPGPREEVDDVFSMTTGQLRRRASSANKRPRPQRCMRIHRHNHAHADITHPHAHAHGATLTNACTSHARTLACDWHAQPARDHTIFTSDTMPNHHRVHVPPHLASCSTIFILLPLYRGPNLPLPSHAPSPVRRRPRSRAVSNGPRRRSQRPCSSNNLATILSKLSI
jgi:hypothetical protein